MPQTIDRSSFVTALTGKNIPAAPVQRAYPALNISSLVHNGVIQGTPENLQRLWAAIDAFDRDGKAATVSSQTSVAMVSTVFQAAGVRPPQGLAGPTSPAAIWQKVSEAGDKAIDQRVSSHRTAIEQTGIGRYYGDHSEWKELVAQQSPDITAFIEAETQGAWTTSAFGNGTVGIQSRDGQKASIKESSCIGWVMEITEAAYRSAGKGARFDQIAAKVKAADYRGTVLCELLQQDGWKAVFYAPEVARCIDDTQKTGAINAAKAGKRIWRATTVAGSQGVKVDSIVLNYQGEATPDEATERKLQQLEAADFFVGVANGGMHTFVGHRGQVCDFHWTSIPNNPDAMTETPLRDWPWDTGLYMVPPGTWSVQS